MIKTHWNSASYDIILLSPWLRPLTPALGVIRTRASGLDLGFNPPRGKVVEVAVIEPLFSKTLLLGVTSALFRGVAFLACVDIERRPAMDAAGSAAALTVERRPLLGLMGLLTLLRVGPVELLTLRFKEEFSLPAKSVGIVSRCLNVLNLYGERSMPLAGDREMLELKLDTDDEDEDVFFLSIPLLL